MVRLKAVGFVEGKKAISEHGQPRRGPSAVDYLLLFVGSACDRHTLTAVIADNYFEDTYFHQSHCDFTILDIIVCIHTKNYIISFIT